MIEKVSGWQVPEKFDQILFNHTMSSVNFLDGSARHFRQNVGYEVRTNADTLGNSWQRPDDARRRVEECVQAPPVKIRKV